MSEEHPESIEYAVPHIREALAEDPGTADLHLEVRISGEILVLSGTVSTEQRRQAAEEVARRFLPDSEIHNQIEVEDFKPPTEAEEIS